MSFNFLANQDPFDQKKQSFKGTFDKFLEIQHNGQSNAHNFTLSSKFPGPVWMAEVGVWLASQKFWQDYFELKLNQYFDGTATIDQVIALFEAMFFEGIVEIGGEKKTILNHYLDFVKVIDQQAYFKFINFQNNIFGEFEITNFQTGGFIELRNITTNEVFKVEQSEKVFLKKNTILLTRLYKAGLLWHFTEGFVAAKFVVKQSKTLKEKLPTSLSHLSQLDSIFNFYKLQELQEKLDALRTFNYEDLIVLFKRKIFEYDLNIALFELETDLTKFKVQSKFLAKYQKILLTSRISLQEFIVLNAILHFLYSTHPSKIKFVRSKFFQESFIQKLAQLPESFQNFSELGIEIFEKGISNIELLEISNKVKTPDIFAKTKNEKEFKKYFSNLNDYFYFQAVSNHLREPISDQDFEKFLLNEKGQLNKDNFSQDFYNKAIALSLFNNHTINFDKFISNCIQILTSLFQSEIRKDKFENVIKEIIKGDKLNFESLDYVEVLLISELIYIDEKIHITTIGKLIILQNLTKEEVLSYFVKVLLLKNGVKTDLIMKLFDELSKSQLTKGELFKLLKLKTKKVENETTKLLNFLTKYGILESIEDKLQLTEFGNIILQTINREMKFLISK